MLINRMKVWKGWVKGKYEPNNTSEIMKKGYFICSFRVTPIKSQQHGFSDIRMYIQTNRWDPVLPGSDKNKEFG